jgi:hypothetical protein
VNFGTPSKSPTSSSTAIVPPPAAVAAPEYEVVYYKRGVAQTTPHDRDHETMIYGLRCCIDENGGPGFVHLASRTDKFGPENAHSVWDGTHAGRWQPSTRAWHAVIEHEVAAQRATR